MSCSNHRRYKAVQKPKVNCLDCWRWYLRKTGDKGLIKLLDLTYEKKAEKQWTVTLKSESCDDYGPHDFDHKPTHEELVELCHDLDGCEENSGPGYGGSYIHVTPWGFELD